jgi:carboxyl-terminal processing protease
LKRSVIDSIPYFQHDADVFRAIQYIVTLIDDGHSIFIFPNSPNVFLTDTVPMPEVVTKVVDGNIGYIKLTGYLANLEGSKRYTDRIRESLYELDRTSDLTGWIIDLRDNIGGLSSMMPFGLAPMFQDSLIGCMINNKGEYLMEYCTNERYGLGTLSIQHYEGLNFDLKNKNKPIAVLMNEDTGSAGEALALSFKFQHNTKTFGTPTAGLTTALENIGFHKSDALLLLATLYHCGPDKEIIYGSVEPDVACSPEESFELAKEWIKTDKSIQ